MTAGLASTSFEERWHAALILARDEPGSGAVLLSYVIWPDEMPSPAVLEDALAAAVTERGYLPQTARVAVALLPS